MLSSGRTRRATHSLLAGGSARREKMASRAVSSPRLQRGMTSSSSSWAYGCSQGSAEGKGWGVGWMVAEALCRCEKMASSTGSSPRVQWGMTTFRNSRARGCKRDVVEGRGIKGCVSWMAAGGSGA